MTAPARNRNPSKRKFFQFFLPGDPVAQPRPRMARTGHAYVPRKHPVHAWREQVARRAAAAIRRWPEGFWPRGEAVEVKVVFVYSPSYLDRLARRKLGRPDVDNLLKAVLDALLGVLFFDDSQVCRVVAEKWYGCLGEPAGLYFSLKIL